MGTAEERNEILTFPVSTKFGSKVGTPAFTSVPGCRIDTKSKKNVFSCTHERQKRYLAVLAFLLYKQ